NEVQSIGKFDSTTRTAEQTSIALFWADNAGTATPPGHWNEIAEDVALQKGRTLAENARMLALLDMAEADAGISAWDAKYTFNYWRPITAIRNANSANNPLITQDPNWAP